MTSSLDLEEAGRQQSQYFALRILQEKYTDKGKIYIII